MDKDALRQAVAEIISAQKLGTVTVHDVLLSDDLFAGATALDSMDCLNLLLDLEERFSLQLTESELTRDQLKTVDRICAFIAANSPAEHG